MVCFFVLIKEKISWMKTFSNDGLIFKYLPFGTSNVVEIIKEMFFSSYEKETLLWKKSRFDLTRDSIAKFLESLWKPKESDKLFLV